MILRQFKIQSCAFTSLIGKALDLNVVCKLLCIWPMEIVCLRSRHTTKSEKIESKILFTLNFYQHPSTNNKLKTSASFHFNYCSLIKRRRLHRPFLQSLVQLQPIPDTYIHYAQLNNLQATTCVVNYSSQVCARFSIIHILRTRHNMYYMPTCLVRHCQSRTLYFM